MVVLRFQLCNLEAFAGLDLGLLWEVTLALDLLPKLSLCPPVPNTKAETEFGVKETKIALLISKQRGATADERLQDCAPLGRD